LHCRQAYVLACAKARGSRAVPVTGLAAIGRAVPVTGFAAIG
jgi:hypothetical protein